MANRVNYDLIAPRYNRRYEASSSEGVARALLSSASATNARRVLEVGCGTGHWLEQLAVTSARLFGLDPSTGMLAEARRRDTPIGLCRARAEDIPFAGHSFDLIYCVNALHHFTDPRRFIREAFRCLRAGGMLAIVGSASHHRRESWYVYHYFEKTFERDQHRFPKWDDIRSWTVDAGFTDASQQIVEEIHDPKSGRKILTDPFLEKSACSQLALLPDAEYAVGRQRIEADLRAAEARGETIIFPCDITLTMLIAHRERARAASRN